MLDDNGRQPQGRNEGGFLDGVGGGEGEVIAVGDGRWWRSWEAAGRDVPSSGVLCLTGVALNKL